MLAVPLAALMGYPFGALPAFLTGVSAAALSGRIRSKVAWVIVAVLPGGLFSVLAFSQIPGLRVMFGLIGTVSALASSIAALQVRPRWSN